jgi:DNA end-binding protein Ku
LVIQDPANETKPKSNVIDLMDALKKSLGDSNDNAPTKKAPAKKAAPARKAAAPPRNKAAGGKR